MLAGRKRRPTYNEIVNEMENNPPKIKYPNRDASALMETPEMQQFLGDSAGAVDFFERQRNMLFKQQLINNTVRNVLNGSGQTTPKYTSGSATPASSYGVYENASDEEIARTAERDPRLFTFTSLVQGVRDILTGSQQQAQEKVESSRSQVAQDLTSVEEQMPSSSSTQPPMPSGLNPIPLPKAKPKKRARATQRKGTIMETDNPEGLPRRSPR